MSDLNLEFEYYLSQKADFLRQYQGKIIVLKDKKILGIYDDRLKAIQETAKTHKIGTFLVQEVTESAHEALYHSFLAI